MRLTAAAVGGPDVVGCQSGSRSSHVLVVNLVWPEPSVFMT